MTTAQPSAARSARAEASGSSGQQDRAVLAAGVGAVDAGVRAHEPVAGAADQPAAVGAHDLGRLVEHDLDRARRPCPTPPPSRAPTRRARRPRGRRRGPPPWRRPCGRRTSTSVGRRSPRAAARRGRRPAGPPGCPRGRPPRCVTPAGAGRRRRPACRRRRPATGRGGSATRTPAARASAAWRAHEPGPNDGAMHVRRVEHQRVGPGAVAVGDDGHAGRREVEQRVDLVGVEQRAVAGDEQHAAGAGRDRGVDRRAARRRSGRPRRGRRRRASATDAMRGSRVTTITRSSDRTSRSAREHVARHPLGQLAARRVVQARPRLRPPERLHGQDRDRAHTGYLRRTSYSVVRSAAGRPAAWAAPTSCSGSSRTPNSRAGHARDRLLHQRPAEVVDAPAQRLRRGVEAHLHPARLQVAHRAAEREPEDGGVAQVVLARDRLDAVAAAELRLVRDEATAARTP